MQLRPARQEAAVTRRDQSRAQQLTGGEIDALLVTTQSLADEVEMTRDLGPLDGILIAVGAGSLIWAAGAWALYSLLL